MGRFGAIDAVRGVAVVLMIMHHCVDAWTRAPDRTGAFWKALRHLGGVPAPGFLVLAGLSAALVLARERQKQVPPRARARNAVRRGLYILGIAFSYRLFCFVVDANPWENLFRVDILNCMGVAMALVAAPAALARSPRGSLAIAALIGGAAVLAAPFVMGTVLTWPTPYVAAYVAGKGPLVLFPLIPWAGFLAAGLVAGEIWGLIAGRAPDARAAGTHLGAFAIVGAALFLGGWAISGVPLPGLPPHDFWRASPVYVGMRIGIHLGLLGVFAFVTPRLPPGWEGRSVLQLLGRHSLAVYLVHLELAYGRPGWPILKKLPIGGSFALLVLVLAAMVALARQLDRRDRRSPAPAPA